MSDVAKRYARAAVSAESGDLAVLAQSVRAFSNSIAESEELREVLNNPDLIDSRDKVLDAVFDTMSAPDVARGLIHVMVRNDRIKEFSAVADEIEAMADAKLGQLRAEVTSAVVLSSEQNKRLKSALEKRFGRPVLLRCGVDESLLGGLICRVGDLTLDSSLKRQLVLVKEQLQHSHLQPSNK